MVIRHRVYGVPWKIRGMVLKCFKYYRMCPFEKYTLAQLGIRKTLQKLFCSNLFSLGSDFTDCI